MISYGTLLHSDARAKGFIRAELIARCVISFGCLFTAAVHVYAVRANRALCEYLAHVEQVAAVSVR